jgi:hypothetical protein
VQPCDEHSHADDGESERRAGSAAVELENNSAFAPPTFPIRQLAYIDERPRDDFGELPMKCDGQMPLAHPKRRQ